MYDKILQDDIQSTIGSWILILLINGHIHVVTIHSKMIYLNTYILETRIKCRCWVR